MSVNEVAVLYGVHRAFVYRMHRSGEIPYQFVGAHRRMWRSDVMRFLDRRDTW